MDETKNDQSTTQSMENAKENVIESNNTSILNDAKEDLPLKEEKIELPLKENVVDPTLNLHNADKATNLSNAVNDHKEPTDKSETALGKTGEQLKDNTGPIDKKEGKDVVTETTKTVTKDQPVNHETHKKTQEFNDADEHNKLLNKQHKG